MKFPWNRKQKIEEMEKQLEEMQNKLEKKEKEKEKFKNRFEAEKERKAKLATQKQEAEEKLNKMQDNGTEEDSLNEGSSENSSTSHEISVEKVKALLEKLESMKSPKKDFVSIYCPGKLSYLPDVKGLKNTVSREKYEFISDEGFLAFIDPDLINVKLSSRDFSSPKWETSREFRTQDLREFISKKKKWAVISAGNSIVIEEADGEILEKEEIESRVDRNQKKGGYSQDRFERKREEQIEEHLDQVEEKIKEETLLLGEKRLCKKLPGNFLGGFDDSKGLVSALYGFRIERMTEV
jgi:predicted RNase H-like nuclease (RuvC/YqgF family)